MILLSSLLLILALVLLVPALVLCLECVLAMFPSRAQTRDPGAPRPSVAVLIPAHDEELTIATAIGSVRPELAPEDRLVVIADNCSDRTADIAREHGAIVIERVEPERKSKGYALRYGLQWLANEPSEVVVILDADCTVSPGTVERLARRAHQSARPVQARYVVEFAANGDRLAALSAFAFLVKSLRPRGLQRLGLPCALMGSGIALPWSLIDKATLDGESLVEDLQWGLNLTLAGYPPMYCPEATVIPRHPRQRHAVMSQRRRWEHGHLATMFVYGRRLAVRGLRSGRLHLIAVALDLCVPPLSLLMLLTTAALGGAWLAARSAGYWTPVGLMGLAGALVGLTVASVWWKFARAWVPVTTLLMAPWYVLWKVSLYRDLLWRRQRAWVRTEREHAR
jgi:cellulose synthase/poly-beta-1,6-N-acetylglucosamine synthase-like glycosyltransferase